jgi:hypothetical protein
MHRSTQKNENICGQSKNIIPRYQMQKTRFHGTRKCVVLVARTTLVSDSMPIDLRSKYKEESTFPNPKTICIIVTSRMEATTGEA